MPKGQTYPQQFREEAVRVARASDRSIRAVAEELGLKYSTLCRWVQQAEIDDGAKPGATSEELAELKALRKESARLRTENEFLKKAAAFFAAETDRSSRGKRSG
jgi:transposase